MKKQFIVANQNSRQRLDKFIASHYPDYSRAYLQKQIKSGAVLVNGTVKKPSYILKVDDKVETKILPPPTISLEPDTTIALKIIYEDNNVIVIDKPAGLTVHPSETQKNSTLINALLAHYPPLKDVGDPSTSSGQALRPGLVHRLDKDTSGLMIIAKNNQAFEWLKKQFQERKVEKKYLALVVGKPKETSSEIKTYLARSKSDPTKQKVVIPPPFEDAHSTPPPFEGGGWEGVKKEGVMREAITSYKTLREFKDFTLIEAKPKTGRMHQIRVHLAWFGCPVAGDKKYGKKNQPLPAGLHRQFLHAAELTIILPDSQKKTFNSSLPHDLEQTLALLK